VAVRARQELVQIEVEKPVGINFKQGDNGLIVTGTSGNGSKTGIEKGDTIVYASSFFGDELWPTDQVGFTRSALNAAPSPVVIQFTKGPNVDYNIKRIPKKPAPARFGRRLTASQKANATHICIDCGYVYCEAEPFEELGGDYKCPQCNAPPRRFAKFDAETGSIDSSAQNFAQLGTVLTVVVGLISVGVLFYLASSV